MTFWVRLIVTIALMVAISYLISLLYQSMFGGARMPSYISGLIGGLVGIPVWEILQKFKADPNKKK